jgi:outer membrane protein assembly factor BamB
MKKRRFESGALGADHAGPTACFPRSTARRPPPAACCLLPAACCLLPAACCLLAGFALAGDWRQFRGDRNQGVSTEAVLPAECVSTQNPTWKAALPGPGPSSPIVVKGRVVVTAASGARQDRLHVLAFDPGSGRLLWQRQFWATGSVIHNPFGGIAAPTPASDGKRIFALYSSSDLACLDLDGNLQWLRGFGLENPATRSDVGMASSPLVIGTTVVVQLENPGASLAAGVEAATGRTRWQRELDHDAVWTSPLVLPGTSPEGDLALLQCRNRLVALDPPTGKIVGVYPHWTDSVASSAIAGGTVFLPSDGVRGLRFDRSAGRFDLVWQSPRLRADTASVVADGARLYVIKSPGILVCGDSASGRVLWQLRLTGPFWATPAIAGDQLFAVNHSGLVQCVQLGREGKLIATTQIDQAILASPAVAGGAIYFRSNSQLWKFGGSGQQVAGSRQ